MNANITVNSVPAIGLGLGVAVWDDHMTDSAVPQIIKNAGFSLLRYPGGSYADLYHWKDNSGTAGMNANIRSEDSFDRFMAIANETNSGVLITVNYGSNKDGTAGGDPAEAAEWVHYSNVVKKYGVKYWEIGNEVYGNGFYNGSPWEVDLHGLPQSSDKSGILKNLGLGPTTYGTNVNAYVTAMKAQDPGIKVGVVLTDYHSWPDGVDPDWNDNVLKACGPKIDFVVVHVYQSGKTAADLYAAGETNIPKIAEQAQAEIARYCGPNAKNVQIFVTEGDASGWNTRLPGALYAAHQYMLWWENGVSTFAWWDLHNGIGVNSEEGYGDSGILSNHSSDKGVTEPPLNDPFPPYYGVEMVHYLTKPGDAIIKASSDLPSLSVHAVRDTVGRVGVMLINKDPRLSVVAAVSIVGAALTSTGTRYDYGAANIPAGIGSSSPITRTNVSVNSNPFLVRVPAATITDLIFH